MTAKNIYILVFAILMSAFLWGISFYFGWINEIGLFGRNTFISWFSDSVPSIQTHENVTTVKRDQFAYMLLSRIVIPDNITTVETNAFRRNVLISITIGSDVELQENAIGFGFESVYDRNGRVAGTFTRLDHKSVDWTIWYGDFSYINQNGNITILGYSKTGGAVEIPREINGNLVTAIGREAFRNKRLTEVTIPNSIVTIGNNAFDENQLTNVVIPNSVVTIGNEAFCCNRLTSITIGNSVSTIGTGAFGSGARGTGGITRVTFPNSVTNIGVNAFSGHPITRVSIGANVTLGSTTVNRQGVGILGQGTGFNGAYGNNNRRAGVYTRSNTRTATWSRAAR